MKDINYFPLDVESNIYSMTTLTFEDKSTKLLVATTDCRIYCINYNKFQPYTREVEFTYIPNGAKIISIGALKRGPNDFVIGITHSLGSTPQKSSTRSSFPALDAKSITYYLNIYASGCNLPNFDLDYIAQGCQTIRLRFVPYHLYQTQATYVGSGSEIIQRPVWILTGGDNNVHVYCGEAPHQTYTEAAIGNYFPELAQVNGLVLWIDIITIEVSNCRCERAIAIALEDGSVRLIHSCLTTSSGRFEIMSDNSFEEYATITTSVRLFRVRSSYNSKLRRSINATNIDDVDGAKEINLLVVNSTNPSLVFENVLEIGLTKKQELPSSQRLDCSTCSIVGDINYDGYNEILIGTHGQELLEYRYHNSSYQLECVTELNHPIYALTLIDLTRDGLRDLVVLLSSGVLLLQASVNDVIETCRKRIDAVWRRMGISV